MGRPLVRRRLRHLPGPRPGAAHPGERPLRLPRRLHLFRPAAEAEAVRLDRGLRLWGVIHRPAVVVWAGPADSACQEQVCGL